MERSRPDWVLPELERRHAVVHDVLACAGLVPAYAFDAPETYDRFLDAMPNEPRYEADVRRAIAGHKSWMPEDDVFPPFE